MDPELQQALDQQKKQREAIKAKKEANRLAIAAKRRLELEEKLAKQGEISSMNSSQHIKVDHNFEYLI